MKRINTIEELSLEAQRSVNGGTGLTSCDCGNVQCTCVCSDEDPKSGTARENHKWEQAAVHGRTERNKNF